MKHSQSTKELSPRTDSNISRPAAERFPFHRSISLDAHQITAATLHLNIASTSPRNPISVPTIQFPVLGVTQKAIEDFIVRCGGENKLKDLTTTEVSEEFVKPMTKSLQKSYCESHAAQNYTGIRTATVFISHAWQFKFLDVVNSLKYHFRHEPNIVIWLDLFSNNQNEAPSLDFDWWCTTFKSAIERFGRTVIILSPWNHPIPLTRAWCLYEIYCAIVTNSRFEIAMSENDKAQFIESIQYDGVTAVNKMIGQIDVRNSDAFKNEDKKLIFAVIESTIGFNAVNGLILECMRNWVIQTTETAIQSLTPTTATSAMNDTPSSSRGGSVRMRLTSAVADLYMQQGAYDKSKLLYDSVLSYTIATLGQNHPFTLTAMSNLAILYSRQGRFADAEPLYQQCYERHREISGPQHKDTLECMSKLGSFYQSQLKYDIAEPILRRCLQVQKAQLGQDHPNTLTTMNNLANLYSSEGKYELAEPMLVQCLQMRRNVLGTEHPQTLTVINNLAGLYNNQKKYDRSELLYKKCLDTQLVKLGDDHPDTLISMTNLGQLHFALGRYHLCEPLFTRCLQLRRKILGNDHPLTLTSMTNLARLFTTVHEYDQALALFEECYSRREATLGADHLSTIASMSNIADLYQAMVRYDQAEILLQQSLELYKKKVGENDNLTLTTMTNLAQILIQRKKYSPAEELLRKLLSTQQNVLSADDMETAMTMYHLGRVFYKTKQWRKVEKYWTLCIESRKRVLGSGHLSTLMVQYRLACLYFRFSRYVELIPLLERGLESLMKQYGPKHSFTQQWIKLAESSCEFLCGPPSQLAGPVYDETEVQNKLNEEEICVIVAQENTDISHYKAKLSTPARSLQLQAVQTGDNFHTLSDAFVESSPTKSSVSDSHTDTDGDSTSDSSLTLSAATSIDIPVSPPAPSVLSRNESSNKGNKFATVDTSNLRHLLKECKESMAHDCLSSGNVSRRSLATTKSAKYTDTLTMSDLVNLIESEATPGVGSSAKRQHQAVEMEQYLSLNPGRYIGHSPTYILQPPV